LSTGRKLGNADYNRHTYDASFSDGDQYSQTTGLHIRTRDDRTLANANPLNWFSHPDRNRHPDNVSTNDPNRNNRIPSSAYRNRASTRNHGTTFRLYAQTYKRTPRYQDSKTIIS
jgi:hypothetical protein